MAEEWPWQTWAACRGVDSSVFFSPDGERGRARTRREARAKELCGGCPVAFECRSHAISSGEVYGTWGGLSEGDRARMAGRHRTQYARALRLAAAESQRREGIG